MQAFPQDAIVSVPSALALELLQAAESLPLRENREYYDFDLQIDVHDRIRSTCRDEFDGLVTTIKTRLARSPFSVVVKGLQFDSGYRLLVALNRAFGNLVARPYDPNTPRDQLIHHIQPSTDITASNQKQSELLHSDCADWPEPNDYLSMQCVRADALGGGRSRLIDLPMLKAALDECAEPEMIDRLYQEDVPWQIGHYLGGGVAWRRVLTPTSLRWRRYTIDFALAEANITLSDGMLAALDRFDYMLAHSDRVIDFWLEPEDYLIMDNKRCLHSRTPIDNPETQRLMLRSWIMGFEPEKETEKAI